MTAVVPATSAGPLEALSRARVYLAEATSLADVVTIRDQAESIRAYLQVQRDSLAMQNEAAELKLRAERKAGVLLAEMPKNPGGRSTATTMTEVGVTHNQSSRWQRIAAIPEDIFEEYIARHSGDAVTEHFLTTAGALKIAKQRLAAKGHDSSAPRPPVDNLDVVPEVFSAIVIDPPWRYDNVATRGAAEDHYGTMTQAELLALELPAATNSHLYLWVTNSFIRDGFELMERWGFTYKTCLTWCKPQIGMGNYFRSTTEHVLFGIRGSWPTLTNNTPTHFIADRRRHSQKPELFYDIVEASSPGPYLEMFARRRRFGWHVWGNEA